MKRESTRSPGRPPAGLGLDARRRLLDTAARLFAEGGYDGTSLKEVAVGADVTPAMIAYYFRDKAGLLEAVVMDGLEHVLEAVTAAAAENTGDQPGVSRLIAAYLQVIDEHPWIPQILVRDVISRDSPLRDLVRDQFMARAVQIVPPLIGRDIQTGRLRPDLDPSSTLLSILGMCVFPYIAEPVLGPLLGYRTGSEFAERYTRHTIELVLSGVGTRP